MTIPTRHRLLFCLAFYVLVFPRPAQADVALLLGEPYGRFAALTPTGHAAVYLSRVCAASPTVLRRCGPGEAGAVISRYHHVAGLDWVAIPLIPYLYSVEHAEHVPPSADRAVVADLRNGYRRRALREIVPDLPGGDMPRGNWRQLIGAAYDRQIIVFTIRTAAAQDDLLIESLNRGVNVAQFNLLRRNCADFALAILSHYVELAKPRDHFADFGVTTPKHVAKSLVDVSASRPELELAVAIVPQVPGSRRQSGKTRGVLESLLTTKKYVIPLALVQPWVPSGLAAGYLATRRFDPRKHATRLLAPGAVEQMAMPDSSAD